eukprot:Gb_19981 [translate_table: standard]
MEGDPIAHLHHKIQNFKQSVKRSKCTVAALVVAVVVLLIALIAVGTLQHKSIQNLKKKVSFMKNPTVAFATGFGLYPMHSNFLIILVITVDKWMDNYNELSTGPNQCRFPNGFLQSYTSDATAMKDDEEELPEREEIFATPSAIAIHSFKKICDAMKTLIRSSLQHH